MERQRFKGFILRKAFVVGILSIIICMLFSANVSSDDDDDDDDDDGMAQAEMSRRFIVQYEPEIMQRKLAGQAPRMIQAFSMPDGMNEVNVVEKRQILADFHLLEVTNAQDDALGDDELDMFMSRLAKIEGVRWVQQDRMISAYATPNDQAFDRQWNLVSDRKGGIRIDTAWDVAYPDGMAAVNEMNSITVAVIDSGIVAHEDLSENVIIGSGYDFLSLKNFDNDEKAEKGIDSDPTDPGTFSRSGCDNNLFKGRTSTWHGTHVTGIIAATIGNGMGVSGVAPNVKIVPVRVIGRCAQGSIIDMAAAMLWSAGLKISGDTLPGASRFKDIPLNPNPAKIINLSVGATDRGACDPLMESVIAKVRAQGVMIVAAAGNFGKNVEDYSPANCPGVTTVSAVKRSGAMAEYSNYGPKTLAAPGGTASVPILSTVDAGTTTSKGSSYKGLSGTSMAAPHVAGVAALLFGINKNFSVEQVTNMLEESASRRPLQPDDCIKKIGNCTMGVVDARAAVTMAKSASSVVEPEAVFEEMTAGDSMPVGAQDIPPFATIPPGQIVPQPAEMLSATPDVAQADLEVVLENRTSQLDIPQYFSAEFFDELLAGSLKPTAQNLDPVNRQHRLQLKVNNRSGTLVPATSVTLDLPPDALVKSYTVIPASFQTNCDIVDKFCDLGDIEPWGGRVIQFDFIHPAVTAGSSFDISASISSQRADTDLSNNTHRTTFQAGIGQISFYFLIIIGGLRAAQLFRRCS